MSRLLWRFVQGLLDNFQYTNNDNKLSPAQKNPILVFMQNLILYITHKLVKESIVRILIFKIINFFMNFSSLSLYEVLIQMREAYRGTITLTISLPRRPKTF